MRKQVQQAFLLRLGQTRNGTVSELQREGDDLLEQCAAAVRDMHFDEAAVGCAGAPLDYLQDHLFKYHTYEWAADAASKEREAAAYVGEVRRFLDEAGG